MTILRILRVCCIYYVRFCFWYLYYALRSVYDIIDSEVKSACPDDDTEKHS